MAFEIHVTDEFARNLNGYFLAMVNGIKIGIFNGDISHLLIRKDGSYSNETKPVFA